MKNHSLIFDDFFGAPLQVKHMIGSQPMEDVKYDDGVVYPNISMLPPAVKNEIVTKLEQVFGPIEVKIMFARYSFGNTTPPHWAHSDREIAEFLGLIYLNEGHPECGTAVVRHIDQGFENHPTDPEIQKILIADANKKDMWDITFECPSKFNRLFILNADLIHAAMGEYGEDKDDGRLVISIFFNKAKA